MIKIISSESVTEGHPDKVCDQISDAILDAILEQDKDGRVACETFTKNDMVIVGGEITSTANVNIDGVVRDTIKEIGYNDAKFGIDYKTCAVLTTISKQSPDISQGVTKGQGEFKEQGAGDQGMMYGYATDETEELMPLPITLAHKLTAELACVRKEGALPYLRPDGKSQVAVEYKNGKPNKLKNVVIAAQHDPDIEMGELRNDIIVNVIQPVCYEYLAKDTKFFINATGKFVEGGPRADAGLTGRKIIVDTYGGVGRHGGGGFSGKDSSKVDRSGAYMARYVAKNIVAAGLAKKCEVLLAYVIGVAEPTTVHIDTFGTGKIDNKNLIELVRKNFGLKPAEIIKELKLKNPIYKETAAYGHFGRLPTLEGHFTWEKINKIEELKKYL